MSVATASMRSHISNTSSPQGKQSITSPSIEYVASKKRKEENYQSITSKGNHEEVNDIQSSSPQNDKVMSPRSNGISPTNSQQVNNPTIINNGNHHPTLLSSHSQYSLTNGQQYSSSISGMNNQTSALSAQQSNMDTNGPLPNEIFELLNEFWRPNEMVAPSETHLMNIGGGGATGPGNKFSRRSPDGSIDEPAEEEKDGEDDITSLADNDMGVDRTTQKRRYSRLSDGYERLKSVLPTVKDKRRVSKARILDEAINYIQRLESITSVLKREHEKRLSMLNGNNGFFPDYSVQPYMRSLFQKQVYPPGGMSSSSKMSSYSKMTSPNSTVPKSPRMKQYNQSYSAQSASMSVSGSNMASGATDYNYNSIGNGYQSSSMYSQNNPGDPNQMMNGDSSPINNTSPYSACSLSPGSTPTTYQNGVTNSVVNNSWPYQAGISYNESSSQIQSYNQSRQSPSAAASYSNSSNPYSALNGSIWGNMGASSGSISDTNSQLTQHNGTEHPMKVG